MASAFIGEIELFAFGFAPKGWALCQGQLLAIAQNQALFSLLGTTYGGNGQTTFALPNLQSRVGISFGQGPGLQNYTLGQTGGVESVTLISTQMPQHNHLLAADNEAGTANLPQQGFLAQPAQPNAPGTLTLYGAAASLVALNAGSVSSTGGNQAHSNIQPYTTLNYCIALQGLFPSRN